MPFEDFLCWFFFWFFIYVFILSKDMLIDFRERGRETGERDTHPHGCARETSISCLLHTPQLGTKPASQACALCGN